MLEHLQAGGLLMIPIVFCSILALAIIVERAVALQKRRVVPPGLLADTWRQVKAGQMDAVGLRRLRQHSPLGRVLGAGLANADCRREVMTEAIEDVGRHEAHRLERFLNTLGTLAAITPLLGLLGTVIGMIKVFSVISLQGLGDTPAMAGGISEALITTAAGLSVAIPTLMAYRYFRGRVEELVVEIEQEALKLVEVLQGQRSNDLLEPAAGPNGPEER
ncbi:MotA/TolQ/ExbB proton channel family protein [Alkalilimnicola ehrlichii MLHE-1]|uniref:MotA/TolQ/ExbB proton channel n=1 Tax=Alkalilimnicola ehrlichii (strain ATCC BAA-1101 / DSM 17681 / MLHE-1) TaxID=187272 RepID=Q0A8Q2_ALKEH|nr:MotA/TolQ/ExbB proton channel family protein [Alkalilimnicola ehrlichii]ABI56785.1 MotA/TolQ/ExbB proton channel [Alkalilimnicola ehrlichii MLHE-1]